VRCLTPKRPLADINQLADGTIPGLHLNPRGYELLFKELMNTINSHWPDQAPENLPFVFPAWDVALK
jgi:hypothetical protein